MPFPMPIRLLGVLASGIGLWMVVAPQARLGLPALRWMSVSAFPGEALVGAVVLFAGLALSLGGREQAATASAMGGEVEPAPSLRSRLD